jgi:very-short-patch-repair endonuclease
MMPDGKIDTIARRQHGAFSRKQAIEVGFTPRMISTRLASRAWVRLDTSVYALTSHPFSWERQAMAATLTSPGGLLSGRAAAALHGIEGFRKGRMEIVVPRGRSARTNLAIVRHSDFTQATRVDGIPCLTVAHTILSLAGSVSTPVLDSAVDHALGRRLVSIDELQDRFAKWAPRRRSGVDSLRAILSAMGGGHVPPTTRLERMLRECLAEAGLPEFLFEYELPWWSDGEGRVDAYSPACKLIVEADGRAWHVRERDFVKDRRRDNLATANGHATMRFTYVDLARYPAESLLLVAHAAASRGWSASRSCT